MPTTIPDLQANWQQQFTAHLDKFQSGQQSFVPDLLPQTAVSFSVYQTLEILHKRLGNDTLRRALDPNDTVASPAIIEPDSSWLKKANMVGVNVRTVGSFWNVINYVLTLPACHDSIHLLPIWEPGVVGSLYGMVSWQINPEFFNVDLARFVPGLDTVEKQLKVTINLIHALGRTVGMDVIPHTDRFSEMVLVHPDHFEWVHREDFRLIDHSENVYRHVEEAIWQFLKLKGAADGTPLSFTKAVFFGQNIPLLTDEQRHSILFGPPGDYTGRLIRRLKLISHLTARGFETLPMTMGPPYRGLHIIPDEFVTDEYGQIWYQYGFNRPQPMARVFGPLARYKFYCPKDDNQHWELDFDRPNLPAWNYFCERYLTCQRTYNFDFMRGDMAHVQLRPTGVPQNPGDFYDPLRAVKHYVQQNGVPHFAFFAETFLAPPNTMAYGNEPDHLEAIDADSTLGDLQSSVVGTALFMKRFSDYDDWLRSRSFAPNFTVMTADKDDPRFDDFYRTGNLFRYFVALFLTDMPSYVALGFEVRNLHHERGINEEYTKLYVFQINDDGEADKVTHGPYQWGENAEQFAAICRIRLFIERIWPEIMGKTIRWIVEPGRADYIAWIHVDQPTHTFVAGMTAPPPDTIKGMPVGYLAFEEGNCRVYRLR